MEPHAAPADHETDSERSRFFNVVDLVNRLETKHRAGKQGRIADYLTRLDFAVLDESAVSPSRRLADNSSST